MRKLLFVLFIILSCLQLVAGLYLLTGELNFVWIHFAGLFICLIYFSIRQFRKNALPNLLIKFMRYFFVVFIGMQIFWSFLLLGMAFFFGFESTSLFYYSLMLLLVLHSLAGFWLNGKINRDLKDELNTETSDDEQ